MADIIVGVQGPQGMRGPQGEKGDTVVAMGPQGFQGFAGGEFTTDDFRWGILLGDLSDQTDLQDELDNRPVLAHRHSAGISEVDPVVTPITNTLNFTVSSATGYFYDNPEFRGILYECIIPTGTLTSIDNSVNYVYAEYDGETNTAEYKVSTDVEVINESNTIPVNTMLLSNGYFHLSHWDRMADGLMNKLHRRLVKTQRYIKEPGGLTISEDGLSVSDGIVWRGARDFHLSYMTFGGAGDLWFFYYDSGNNNWDSEVNIEPYNNTQYNDRVTGLQTLTDNYYTINWLYRGVEDSNHVYYILGDKEYKDIPTAISETIIPTIPMEITSHAILVGRIIVQKGSNVLKVEIGSGETFSGSVINEHNELSGLNVGEYQHLTQSQLQDVIYHNHQSGIDGQPEWIPVGDGTFTMDSGVAWFYTDNSLETLIFKDVVGGILTPNDDITNYVCAYWDGVSPTAEWVVVTNLNTINYTNYIPYFIVYKRIGSTTLHVQNITLFAHSEVEKHHNRVLECSRYDKAPSALLGLTVDTGLNITLGGGGVWTVNKRYEIEPVTINTEHHLWVNQGGGIWVMTDEYLGPLTNNTQYNGPTGLVELSDPSKWTINYLYRGIEDQDHTYMVLGTNEYDSIELAKSSNLIGSLPSMILSHAMFVGRIIVQKGATTGIVCESAFDTVFAASTPVSDHNNLSNKQGGQTGEYYHLDEVQHNILVGGTGTDANSLHIHPHDHNNETIQPDVILFNTPSITPTGVGSTYWDDTYKCLATKTTTDTTIQHGQEVVVYCHNDSGVSISNGEVVYSIGGADRVPTIALANSTIESESYTLGLATQAIGIGEYGFVTVLGNVNGVSTDGSTADPVETWLEGDTLYLSSVDGKMTNIKPLAPLHMNRIGRITFSDNSDGTIFVQPDNGYELNEIHNVKLTTGTAGESLVYDVDGLWKNHTINQTDVGLGNVDNTSDLNKPLSNATTGALELKVDKVIGAGLMYNVDRDRLSNTSGTNTGDQDLSGLVTKTTTVNGYELTGPVSLTHTDISGVEFVDNTSDLDKPLSNATTGALSLKVPYTLLDETMAWTGFLNPNQVQEFYNYADRTITLNGDLTYYWRGIKYDLGISWTSTPHPPDEDIVYYLYSTDGSGFNWYIDVWDITDMQIVRVNYKSTEETSFAIRECHGIMDPTVHEYLHKRLRTYCDSGGEPVVVLVNTYTDQANSPDFNEAYVIDEDLQTYIPYLTSGEYTLAHINGGVVFTLNSPLPFIHNGSFIQVNDPNTGLLVDGVDGMYYNVYQILVPVTSDLPSQKYKMVFLQPQRAFSNLLSAQMEPLSTLNLSNIGVNSAEYVVHTRVTYFTKADETNSGKCCIPPNGISVVDVVSSQLNQHEQLSNLNWTDSGHKGVVGTVAGFNGFGEAHIYNVTGNNHELVTSNSPIWDTKADLVGGKVPITQLPSGSLTYEDYPTYNDFPGNPGFPLGVPSTSVVYTAIDTILSYRWTGSLYVISSSALVLGESSTTAYRGDRGKIAYDHSQIAGGGATGNNPHGTTYIEVGAAPANQGVTNGNTHDHLGGDGGQINYSSLSNLPTLGTAASTSSSDYAPANQGVTNGNTHDHLGGDGGVIAYTSITGLPTLGTAAAKDIPSTGNASVTQVVYGTDTRLTDSRNPLAHTQAESTITFTDITTGNSTTGAHGYFPKLPIPTGNYLRDDMTWQQLTNSTVGLGNVLNQTQYYSGGQIIPVSDGGIGVGTITGILFGNGTGPVTTAIPLVDYDLPSQYGLVTTTNATTTGQTLTDITGMTVTLEANTVYEINVTMTAQSSSNAGNRYGVQFTGAGATIEASIIGMSGNATSNRNERISAFNTQTGVFLGSSNTPGGIRIGGVVQTGANIGTLSIRHLKVTSGTSTVFINSFLKVSKIS